MPPLGPDTAQVFRITHVNNIPWILDHGLHCQSASVKDPNFIPIGMQSLIDKRSRFPVPIHPYGVLADFVPFYFTPWSIMLLNIHTGRNGVTKRPNQDIAILVSSLPKLESCGVPHIFTNGHAYTFGTEYFADRSDLDKIDWSILKRRDFRRDPEDPAKQGRYQAEALAHRTVPVQALLGIACYDDRTRDGLEQNANARGLSIPVKALPDWYFR